jgi:hypothetical protein
MTDEVKCRNCGSSHAKRVTRVWPVEHALSLAYVYPFQCQICGERFRASQWGIRYERKPEDRRVYERLPFKCHVRLTGNALLTEGWTTDLAIGGCRMESNIGVAVRRIVSLEFDLAGESGLRVDRAIVRSAHKSILGIEFLDMLPNSRARLKEIMLEMWNEATCR